MAAGFQGLPALLRSQTAPSSAGSVARGRFQRPSSAHTLPTETIRAQAVAAKFLRPIWWTEEENPQRPPRKCPMSGNVCFHSLLLSMSSTHGYGSGLDPIHTEANQKQLFPEINLSLGNELYIHLCGGPPHTYSHTHVCYALQTTCTRRTSDRQPEPPGREGDGRVGFKGHGGKRGLWESPVRGGAL